MSPPNPAPTPMTPRDLSVEACPVARALHARPRLDSYTLLEPLGGGGIAEIWLSEHPALPQPVAVKIARQSLIDNPHVHQQFERERRAAALLDHRGVVQAYYGGTSPRNTPFLVMERVEGRPLSQFVGQPLRWRFLRAALLQLCEALDYMHGQGVLHQDLKPSNLLIDFANRQLKIADFGLASFERSPSGSTTRSVLGTPAYMAPEQARGQLGWLGAHTDLYTVGVLLYELLSGAKPFTARDARVVMLQHCTAPVPPLELRRGLDAPEGIHDILERLLAKNPNARIASARELCKRILALDA